MTPAESTEEWRRWEHLANTAATFAADTASPFRVVGFRHRMCGASTSLLGSADTCSGCGTVIERPIRDAAALFELVSD